MKICIIFVSYQFVSYLFSNNNFRWLNIEISDLPYFCVMNATSFILSFGLYVSVSALLLSSLHCVHLCYRNKPILPFTLLFFMHPFFSSLDNFSLHPLIFFPLFSFLLLKKKTKSLLWYCVKDSQLLYVGEEKKIKRRGGEGAEWGWLVDLGKKRGKNSRKFCSWTGVNHGLLLRLELKFCHQVVTKFIMRVHLW